MRNQVTWKNPCSSSFSTPHHNNSVPAFHPSSLPLVIETSELTDFDSDVTEAVDEPRPPTSEPKPQLDSNGKLTGEERQHRMKLGLCLYCRDKGHLALACPKSAVAKLRAATLAKCADSRT